MNSLKKVAIAALLSTTAFGGALAADAIGLPPPIVPEVPVFDPGSAFDWNGFYAGASVGGLTEIAPGDTSWTLGGHVGVNAAFDFFLVGAEVAVDAVFDDVETYAYGQILARGGIVITDELLAYAAVGYGSDFGATAGAGEHILAGGGLEFAVTDDVSIRGQYLHGWEQTGGGSDIHKFTIGASFHF